MKIGKRIRKKILLLLAAACLSSGFLAVCVQAEAKEAAGTMAEGYTYTVTVYAGSQGIFTDRVRLSVDHRESGSTVESQVEAEEGMVRVKGLIKDDIIVLDLQPDSIRLNEESHYYVKGIRKSGRDNNTVAASAFRVDRDADYVVAYGVRGDMVGYTVNYQDTSGNAVLPSERHYGSIGDKPVAAYKYKEGYEPEVMALTKTLAADEAENVFTFIYNRVVKNKRVVTRQLEMPGTTANTITEILPGTVPEAVPEKVPIENGTAEDGTEGAREETAVDGGNTEERTAGEETVAGETSMAEETMSDGMAKNVPLQRMGEEEVPLANHVLKDLDGEENPDGNARLDEREKKGLPLAACIGIALAALAALIVLFIVVKKRGYKKGIVY